MIAARKHQILAYALGLPGVKPLHCASARECSLSVWQDRGVPDGVEILVVGVADLDGRQGFAVRCHAGTLRVGDELTYGIDGDGRTHALRVRCAEIRLSPELRVEELETNFGGGVVLEGPDASQITADWVLRSE
jgi:hypothetical protein